MRALFFAAACAALAACQCNSPSTCTTAASCGAGQVCLPIGQCAPSCTSGCLAGERCSSAGGCIPSGACGADTDCSGGQVCSAQGACNSKCTATSCGSGQTCTADGHCVGGTGGGAGGGGGSNGGSGGAGGGVPCPAGVTCDSMCPAGATTSISGKVYDPAGKNVLYNAAVYVPAGALSPLPRGVPTGANACSCEALFPSGAFVQRTTLEDGTFTLPDVPVGTDVHLVIQIGKWRRLFHVNVTACMDNPQPDKSLTFPSTVAAGDTDDNMPDIAVSTGSADTLECLMRRIGLPKTEYVAGAGMSGHVHMFSGGAAQSNSVGTAENPTMAGAPVSSTDLWASSDQLMPYDILLLSCEGGETYNANPPALETYLNNGGRVFASHFHYAWFSGPLGVSQNYAAPVDWGLNLALWTAGGGQDNGPIGGIIETTLNGSTAAFPKGVSIAKWLGNVQALGTDNVPATELAIYQPRYNTLVTPLHVHSQPWITSDNTGQSGATMYFSFDAPVNAPPQADGGAPAYCGRAVFSDLHVAGNPSTADNQHNSAPPDGCLDKDLSPQEKALEFMLFDLSSCVVSDTVPPIMIE